MREIARECGVPIQEFAVRNDCPCGSTIGPIISANTGMFNRGFSDIRHVLVCLFAFYRVCLKFYMHALICYVGIRAVDLGMPQLSMHSIREMMGVSDLTFAHRLFTHFFKDFRRVDDGLSNCEITS